MKIDWNEEKNRHLIQTRGISFEVVEEMIRDKSVLLEPHPDQDKHPGQILLLFKYENYWWVCPAVELNDGFFLKTIYPSRKVTKERDDG